MARWRGELLLLMEVLLLVAITGQAAGSHADHTAYLLPLLYFKPWA